MIQTPMDAGVHDAVQVIRERSGIEPEIALVLGSGLGALADAVEDAVVVPTTDLPGYPSSTVAGHSGRLVLGKLAGRRVVVVQGRVHLYEGYSMRAVTFPIRLVHALGALRLVLTNAAGGIHPLLRPGTLMFIADHINLTFARPPEGPKAGSGPRLPGTIAAYDLDWLDRAEQIALREGIPTRRGVYLWTRGPSYETPAEIRFFQRLGADAVGMSTVPEAIQAAYLGMKTLGLSTITNAAAGLGAELLDHADVLDVGRRVRRDLERLLRAILAET